MKTIEIWKKNIKLLFLLGLQMLKIRMCAYWQEGNVQTNGIFKNETIYIKTLTTVVSDCKDHGRFLVSSSIFPVFFMFPIIKRKKSLCFVLGAGCNGSCRVNLFCLEKSFVMTVHTMG